MTMTTEFREDTRHANPTQAKKMITVDTINRIEGFEALREEWNELLVESDNNNLFLTWEWLFTWWQELAEDRELFLVTVREQERLIAIAPLAIRPPRPKRLIFFKTFEFLGSGTIGSDYLGMIVRRGYEDEGLRNIGACMTEQKLNAELTRIARREQNMTEFALQLRQLGWRSARTVTDYCPYIDLSGHDWDSYVSTLSKSQRYNFRRRQRKLEKDYEVKFEEADSEESRSRCLKALVDLHLKRWDTKGGSDALEEDSHKDFHEIMTRKGLEQGWLKLYVLWLDGKPAAALYGYLYGGKFYFYQSGFDPDFYKQSVGLVIMGLAIQKAIEAGAQEYDFLHGNESYKYSWTDSDRELIRLDLFPPSAKGMVSRGIMEARWKIKPVVKRLRPEAAAGSGG